MDACNSVRRKGKVILVMGATGTGKSRLSIDLATHFPAEIINADKMQVYRGLSIVTNKVTVEERCGVPHHLLGVVEQDSEFSAEDFRHAALATVDEIVRRRRLPIIAGGSNSYIEALIGGEGSEFRSRYDCCFLWVDVAPSVLHRFVSKRVDQMVESGLVDEVRKIYMPEADYTRGIRRAIGVPEMERFLRAEKAVIGCSDDEAARARILEAAVDEIKLNTCKLTCCQLKKIHRLRKLPGWNLHRLEATEVFESQGATAAATWERLVVEPSLRIVRSFLEDGKEEMATIVATLPIGVAVAVGGDEF